MSKKPGDYLAKPGIPRVQRQTVEGQTHVEGQTTWPTHGDGRVLERCVSGSA
jgi:hypothetical protein